MARGGSLRGVVPGLFLVALLALLAGCISVPSGGPVLSYSITQGPGGQSQPLPQIVAQPPRASWTKPEQIVRGFLAASASFSGGQRIAREYLTAKENRAWTPNWSAVVYSSGPNVHQATYTGTGSGRVATVTIGGSEQTFLSGPGHAAPSASAAGGVPGGPPTFRLQKVGGQWRISKAPPYLVLTSYAFQYDYQLRNLYFFDPTGSVLVPDPVYVPLQATTASLMDGLVDDLINPPGDWLSRGATNTAFPPKTTTIGDVTLQGGTAAVNLGGAITKRFGDKLLMQQVSAQLLYTLTGPGGSGSAVQSVELSVNGKPWSPPGSDLNPVQQQRQSKYVPASGASKQFYYVDDAGDLQSRTSSLSKAVKVAHIGTGFTQIAVSPDKQYIAALKDGALFTGRIGRPLVHRAGDGYTSLSWDPGDDLWATSGGQIVTLSGAASPGQLSGKPHVVGVLNSDDTTQNVGPFTALRVAPDGVRVAIIVGGNDLDFGAFVPLANARPGQAAVEIVLSQFYVSVPSATFTSVTWYGPDNVIALRDPGPELTEYPVDGGTSTSIPAQSHMSSITASIGNPLIAALPRRAMMADTSLSGSWMNVTGTGISAVYPG